MPRLTRQKLIFGGLLMLLAASLIANVILYRQASRPLYAEGDQPLIERTVARFAAQERTSAEEVMADSFAIVVNLGDRRCVELRRIDAMGHRGACYDRQGRLLEETGSVVN